MIAVAYLWYVLQSGRNDKRGKVKTEVENVQINVSNFPSDPTALESAEMSRKPETDHNKYIFSQSQESSASETICVRYTEQTMYSRCSQHSHTSGYRDLPVCSCSPEIIISQTDSANDSTTNAFSQNTCETLKSETDVLTDHNLNYTSLETCHETSDSETGISKDHGRSQSQTNETEVGVLQEHAYINICSQMNKTSDLEAGDLMTHAACFSPVKTENCSQYSASVTDSHSAMSVSFNNPGEEHSTGVEDDVQLHDTQSHDRHEDKRIQRGPTFNPPVYAQRYNLVHKVLQHHGVESVVDFGCAGCKNVYYLKNVETIQRIFLVDLDENVLRSGIKIIKPDIFEFIWPRLTPLTISMLHGSAGDLDRRIVGCQAASLVEIIEHLKPDMLKQVTHNVFGRLRPSVIIVTTPNADFNILFPNFTGFRHWDHKFEWTKEEFQQWCRDVCQQYGYTVSFTGVGDPPPEMSHVGFCSQAGIFTETSGKAGEQTQEEVYKLIYEEVYPLEKRTSAERLANEADYRVNTLMQPFVTDEECGQAVIPVTRISSYVLTRQKKQDNWTEKDVVEYLQTKYTLTEDGVSVIVPLEDSTSSGSDSYLFDEEPLDDIEDSLGQETELLLVECWD